MALKNRRKIFLSEPRWKTLPWDGVEKSARDHLIDILVDIPSLFQRLDEGLSSDDTMRKNKFFEEVWSGCLELERKLSDWHSTYAPTESVSHMNFTADDIPPSIPSPTLPELAAAHLMTLYWTTGLLLYGFVRDVLLTPNWADGNRLPLMQDSTDSDNESAYRMCTNLVRAIPIFCHPAVGVFRLHLFTFPVSVAITYMYSAPGNQHDLAEEKEIARRCLLLPCCANINKFLGNMWSKSRG